MAYGIFQKLSLSVGATFALFIAIPTVLIGIVIALVKIAEMTFLPIVLSSIRLSLNAKSRIWSIATDSYSDLDV